MLHHFGRLRCIPGRILYVGNYSGVVIKIWFAVTLAVLGLRFRARDINSLIEATDAMSQVIEPLKN